MKTEDNELTWQFFPRNVGSNESLNDVLKVFQDAYPEMKSQENQGQASNLALHKLGEGLQEIGFAVELGKKTKQKIAIPVLYKEKGQPQKSFFADAYNAVTKTVIEVEAGRAIANNQVLKDFFEACVMDRVEYLVLAVRNVYEFGKKHTKSDDFRKTYDFFDTFFTSNRVQIPLKAILLIGY
jgi:hypothetical protein